MADTETPPFSMEATFSSVKSVRRKGRRSHKHHTPEATDSELSEMFLGVHEVRRRAGDGNSLDLASQRSESDERSASRASQSQVKKHSRGSVSKPESSQPAAGEDLLQRETTTLARQNLASSASRVRPSKQPQPAANASVRQPPPPPQQRGGSHSRAQQLVQAINNNNEDDDEPSVEEEGGRNHWGALYDVDQTSQLPSRSHRYLNLSAGFDTGGTLHPASHDFLQQEEDSPQSDDSGLLHADRPPSRQCHAFPTDLLEAHEFFSPVKHHEGALAITITPWHTEDDTENDDERVSRAEPEEDVSDNTAGMATNQGTTTRQRPPSRYMTKAPRGSSSSSASSSSPSDDALLGPGGRLPSRRGVAGSWNQAAQHHHDPKTDGFAEVDESVPPPFRVEISTNSYHSQYVPPEHRRADDERRHSLKSRRSSSFGTRAQLKKLEQQQQNQNQNQTDGLGAVVKEARATTKRPSKTRQSKKSVDPQWLGNDQDTKLSDSTTAAQRRNSHTRIVPPPPATDNNDTYANSSSGSYPSSNSALAAAVGGSQQWFRASNNPFFEATTAATNASGYEDMDAETAIANTPLFTEEDDLMAITQLSDLKLDDFMGDPFVTNPPVNTISTTSTVSTGNTAATMMSSGMETHQPSSASLKTSLGKDFLSLFAQH